MPFKWNRMNEVEERLVEGEKIVRTAAIHWGIYWKACAVFVFSLLVALVFAVELGIFLAFVAIIMGVYAVIKKEILLLVLTDKRILTRYGMLQVDVVDIHFDKVESVELERMWLGYMLGYANVILMGTGNRYIVIPYVANGVDIRRTYNELTLNKDN
ncbi:MAG: PH domain-containing protein [Alphaproteobacteria bacterium]